MREPPNPQFIEIVADTLVEMDVTTPEARLALADLAHAPGFSRLAAAALEAWAVSAQRIEPVPDNPKAVRAIRDLRTQAAHLEALLSSRQALPIVRESLAALWLDPTFAALWRVAHQAHARKGSPLDSTSPAGQFMRTIFAALAQLERDQIVKRTTDGRTARGRKDGELGGSLPLGYRREGGVVKVDTVGAATAPPQSILPPAEACHQCHPAPRRGAA